MTINTKKVQGRRQVRYESLDDFLADAKQLAEGEVKTLGNLTLGQILGHVALSLDASIGGTGFMMPAPVRFLMSLMMKKKYLTGSLPAGFKSPSSFVPEEMSVSDGLAKLQAAVDRQDNESERSLHPAFGSIGRDGWDAFNLRHAELHMSFVLPVATE